MNRRQKKKLFNRKCGYRIVKLPDVGIPILHRYRSSNIQTHLHRENPRQSEIPDKHQKRREFQPDHGRKENKMQIRKMVIQLSIMALQIRIAILQIVKAFTKIIYDITRKTERV